MASLDREAGVRVGGFGENCTDDMLSAAFSPFGTIVDTFIKAPGRSRRRGYGFITFSDRASVQAAIDGAPEMIGEDAITVEARTPAPVREVAPPSASIYIKGIDASTDDASVQAAAEGFGIVESLEVVADRGFAFVTFSSVDEAATVVAAQPLLIAGSFCDVEFRMSQPRQKKSGGVGGGGGEPRERKPRERKPRERKPQEPREPQEREPNSVYLKGVPAECADEDIQAALSGFGTATSVSHRQGRNFAFAVFDSPDAMNSAVAGGVCTVDGNDVTIEPRN